MPSQDIYFILVSFNLKCFAIFESGYIIPYKQPIPVAEENEWLQFTKFNADKISALITTSSC